MLCGANGIEFVGFPREATNRIAGRILDEEPESVQHLVAIIKEEGYLPMIHIYTKDRWLEVECIRKIKKEETT